MTRTEKKQQPDPEYEPVAYQMTEPWQAVAHALRNNGRRANVMRSDLNKVVVEFDHGAVIAGVGLRNMQRSQN